MEGRPDSSAGLPAAEADAHGRLVRPRWSLVTAIHSCRRVRADLNASLALRERLGTPIESPGCRSGRLPTRSGPSKLKIFAYLIRRPGTTREEFIDYYQTHHVPLVPSLAPMPRVHKAQLRRQRQRSQPPNRRPSTPASSPRWPGTVAPASRNGPPRGHRRRREVPGPLKDKSPHRRGAGVAEGRSDGARHCGRPDTGLAVPRSRLPPEPTTAIPGD